MIDIKRKLLLITIAITLFCSISLIASAKGTSLKASIAQQVGDWIYYLDDSQEGSLCKVNTDGTQATKLYDLKAKSFFILDNWIYYIKSDSIYYDDGILARIRLDGTMDTEIFVPEYSSVRTLNYTDGFIVFDAGEIYKMSIKDLKPVIIKDSVDGDTACIDGKFISVDYNTITTYDLKNDKEITTTLNESIGNVVIDAQWIYYLKYHIRESRYTLEKLSHDGSQKVIVLKDLILANDLQLFDDYLYFSARYYTEDGQGYYALHKTSTKGKNLEILPKELIDADTEIDTVISGTLYYSNNPYIAFYNIKDNSFTYKALPNTYTKEENTVMNEKGNIYFIKDQGLMELAPDLTVKDITPSSLSSSEIELEDISALAYDNGIMALKGYWTDLYILNMKKNSLYTIKGTDKFCDLVGIDNKFVYIKEDMDEDYLYKLYRLPLGVTDFSKKQFICDTDEVYFEDGYIINQTARPVFPEDALYKIDLNTLQSTRINSHFVYDVTVANDYLYYPRGTDGAVYKANMKDGRYKRIFQNDIYISNLISNKDTLFMGTWLNGSKFFSCDLDGQNAKTIADESIDFFIGANDQYAIYKASYKFTRYTPGSEKPEILSELLKKK